MPKKFSKEQEDALHLLAIRKLNQYNLSETVREAITIFELWYYIHPYKKPICLICFQQINLDCDCPEPHPGLDHAMEDFIVEHGIIHLKEHGLLSFI